MSLSLKRRQILSGGLISSLTALGYSNLVGAKESPAKQTEKKEVFDLIILGAGCAGLVAALEASKVNAKVLLLEKASRPDGNSIYAIGTICCWGTKVHKELNLDDTKETFFDAMMKISSNRADPTLIETYTNHIPEDVDWLIEKTGITLKRSTKRSPWPIEFRACNVDGEGITGGGQLIKKLLTAVKQTGTKILFEHKAINLLTNENGEVIGVKALTREGYKNFFTNGGVLLATGGFSANQEMVTQYMGGWAARLAIRGSKNTTGENISLSKPLFAKLVSMDQFHSGPIVSRTHVNPVSVINGGQGIIIDYSGKRFIDEGSTYVAKAKACAQSTLDNKAVLVIDSRCPRLETVIKKFERLNTPYGKADSVEEAAKQMGLDSQKVVSAVNEYNQAVKDKNLKNLEPPCNHRNPLPIEQGPFYIIPFEGGMTATFGGPLINTKAEVLTLENDPIPGLYAAGNAAGGLFYNNYIAGSQLGAATVFGRIAANQAIERAKHNKLGE